MDGKNYKVLEFRTDSGELLFRLKMTVKNEVSSDSQKEGKTSNQRNGGNGGANGEKKDNKSGENYQLMTDAQKRYLFRLLAGQGIEGDAAHDELKNAFSVDNLKKVTKMEASREIEKRLGMERGGASNGQI